MKTALLLALLASMADAKCSTCELVDDVLKVTHKASQLPDADTHRCWNQAAELDSHYTVKGQGSDGIHDERHGGLLGAAPGFLDERAELDSELREIRCCSDTGIVGIVSSKTYQHRYPDSCSVWGASISGTCGVAPATYTAAKQYCEDDGARLCTREEMRNDCTKYTGCDLDASQIWTSSPAEDHCMCQCMNHDSGSHLLAKGSGSGETEAAANTDSHKVRCCSDYALAGRNAAGWLAYRQKGDCSVWGASELQPSIPEAVNCVSAATYSEAEAHCLADGARLCTAEEVNNGCTLETGCNFDGSMIWTMTPA